MDTVSLSEIYIPIHCVAWQDTYTYWKFNFSRIYIDHTSCLALATSLSSAHIWTISPERFWIASDSKWLALIITVARAVTLVILSSLVFSSCKKSSNFCWRTCEKKTHTLRIYRKTDFCKHVHDDDWICTWVETWTRISHCFAIPINTYPLNQRNLQSFGAFLQILILLFQYITASIWCVASNFSGYTSIFPKFITIITYHLISYALKVPKIWY